MPIPHTPTVWMGWIAMDMMTAELVADLRWALEARHAESDADERDRRPGACGLEGPRG